MTRWRVWLGLGPTTIRPLAFGLESRCPAIMRSSQRALDPGH
jgi:hypothetical protein